ncbi:MAG: hypothetical protein MK212_19755 [Saprospiraceae bacterium]|nr:hypothetical protein [Saprospiraceae bacterium]
MKALYITPAANVFRLEGDILKEVWTVPELTDVTIVEKHMELSEKWYTETASILILVDGSVTTRMDKAIRDFIFSFFEEKQPKGIAILAKSAISRAIGTMLLALKRPSFNIKLFSDEQKAYNWLLEQKNK